MPALTAERTQSSVLYDRIRSDLLGGEFVPGAKLPLDTLAGRYGAGLTPVREALNRLTAEGLVERRDQRGFAAAGVSAEDLMEITRTRCWLEELALRQSFEHRTSAWEERLLVLHHRLSRTPRSLSDRQFENNPDWEPLHREFHQALIGNCGSQWLIGFCEQLSDQLYRYRQLSVRHAYPTRNEAAEHAEIVNALLSGRIEDAVALLKRHFEATCEMVLKNPALFGPTGSSS